MLQIRIRMYLGLPDPDPLVRYTDPDPSIIKQNSQQNLDSFCFVTSLCDSLSLKNVVSVPFFSKIK
jgi:hypothetical protein